jgi:hypothetical protein
MKNKLLFRNKLVVLSRSVGFVTNGTRTNLEKDLKVLRIFFFRVGQSWSTICQNFSDRDKTKSLFLDKSFIELKQFGQQSQRAQKARGKQTNTRRKEERKEGKNNGGRCRATPNVAMSLVVVPTNASCDNYCNHRDQAQATNHQASRVCA